MGNSASCGCYKDNKIKCQYCKNKYCSKCLKYKIPNMDKEEIHYVHKIIECNTCHKKGVDTQRHDCRCYVCDQLIVRQKFDFNKKTICYNCYSRQSWEK